MSGCFGTVGDPLGRARPDLAQEAHPTLSCFRLYQQGALVQGWAGTVDTGHGGSLRAIREAGKIIVGGAPIAVRPHACLPAPVFGCPICGADRYKLYYKNGMWSCPKCHGLDRASRHQHRSVPGYWRLRQLRRRVGAPELFSPIAPRRIDARRFWRDVLEIRRLEAALCGHAGHISATIEKRYGRT